MSVHEDNGQRIGHVARQTADCQPSQAFMGLTRVCGNNSGPLNTSRREPGDEARELCVLALPWDSSTYYIPVQCMYMVNGYYSTYSKYNIYSAP